MTVTPNMLTPKGGMLTPKSTLSISPLTGLLYLLQCYWPENNGQMNLESASIFHPNLAFVQ